MDVFMITYEENLKKEQEKIEQLEKDIVFALEHSSSNIDLDLSEIDSLKQKDGYSATYDESKHSIESLMKDYERFQSNLKKVRTEKYLIFFIYNLKKNLLILFLTFYRLRQHGSDSLQNCKPSPRKLKS